MPQIMQSETNLRRIAQSIRELWQGRSDATGQCTLATSATTTTVAAINCGDGSKVLLTPLTAHAAAEIGNGTLYVSAVSKGQFILTHASNTQTDRTYAYAIQG